MEFLLLYRFFGRLFTLDRISRSLVCASKWSLSSFFCILYSIIFGSCWTSIFFQGSAFEGDLSETINLGRMNSGREKEKKTKDPPGRNTRATVFWIKFICWKSSAQKMASIKPLSRHASIIPSRNAESSVASSWTKLMFPFETRSLHRSRMFSTTLLDTSTCTIGPLKFPSVIISSPNLEFPQPSIRIDCRCCDLPELKSFGVMFKDFANVDCIDWSNGYDKNFWASHSTGKYSYSFMSDNDISPHS